MPPPGMPSQGQMDGGPSEGGSIPPNAPPFNQRGFPPPPPGFPGIPPGSAGGFGIPAQFFGGPPPFGQFNDAGGPHHGMMPHMPPFGGFPGALSDNDSQFDPRGSSRMRMRKGCLSYTSNL